MKDLKIINKYPILTEVIKVNENSILLKFNKHQYFDLENDIYELSIFGKEVVNYIEYAKIYNLNTPTIIIEETNELDFFVGNMDESPDWGDWNGQFSMPFEKYNGKFSEKTQDDWKNELMYIINDQVRTKAFQSVTDSDFRSQKLSEIKNFIQTNLSEPKTKETLDNLLNKVEKLDDGSFYNIFMNGYKLD